LPNLAESHLYKTLLKTKAIAESPALPQSIKTSVKPATDPATANVTARLYNANPVKEVMAEHLRDLRAVMGIKEMRDVVKNPKTERAERVRAQTQLLKSEGEDDISISELDSDAEAMLRAKQASRRLSDVLGEAGGSSSDSEGFGEFDARVAASSEEETDEEMPGEEEIVNGDARSATKGLVEYRPSSLSPPPEDESDDDSVEPASASPKPAAKKPKANRTAPAPRTSTFLPSLTMGGYWSGSDSEPEDITEEVAPRKNRRGQRARQAIAELKHGAKAKHLARQQGSKASKTSRDTDWDPKRGARSGGNERGRVGARGWSGSDVRSRKAAGDASATGANDIEVKPRRAGENKKQQQDGGKLHPSWEAAKKAKEQKVAQFQGKKVTFD